MLRLSTLLLVLTLTVVTTALVNVVCAVDNRCIAANVLIERAELFLNRVNVLASTYNVTLVTPLVQEASRYLQQARTLSSEGNCTYALRYAVQALILTRRAYVATVRAVQPVRVNVSRDVVSNFTTNLIRFVERVQRRTVKPVINRSIVKICLQQCRHDLSCAQECVVRHVWRRANYTFWIQERVRRFLHRVQNRTMARVGVDVGKVIVNAVQVEERGIQVAIAHISHTIHRLEKLKKFLARVANSTRPIEAIENITSKLRLVIQHLIEVRTMIRQLRKILHNVTITRALSNITYADIVKRYGQIIRRLRQLEHVLPRSIFKIAHRYAWRHGVNITEIERIVERAKQGEKPHIRPPTPVERTRKGKIGNMTRIKIGHHRRGGRIARILNETIRELIEKGRPSTHNVTEIPVKVIRIEQPQVSKGSRG